MIDSADLGSAALQARLTSGTPRGPRPHGLLQIPEASGSGLLYRPRRTDPAPSPVAILFHGSRAGAEQAIEIGRAHADRLGFLLLAPQCLQDSWDIIVEGRYGADVEALDRTLTWLGEEHGLDAKRVVIGGFSDGASYGLSLGITNGHLFSHIVAFSPGFLCPTARRGSPDILIAHGSDDPILPAVSCSQRIVSALRAEGRNPQYHEFTGDHSVPEGVAAWAFDIAFASPSRPN